MSEPLALQTPALGWAEMAASHPSADLAWVSLAEEAAFSQRLGSDDQIRWHGADRRALMPPPVADAVAEASAAGIPTAWDGLALVFGRAEWLVASRHLLWTPSSPVPKLLAQLVESAGIEPALHRGDPDRLRRLAALIPRWGPRRGTVARAAEILETAGEGAQAAALLPAATSDDERTAPSATAGELFAARGTRFWAKRQVADRDPVYRISGGFLRFQPRADAATAVRKEDLLLRVAPEARPPRDLYRLLPAWTVARPVGPLPGKE